MFEFKDTMGKPLRLHAEYTDQDGDKCEVVEIHERYIKVKCLHPEITKCEYLTWGQSGFKQGGCWFTPVVNQTERKDMEVFIDTEQNPLVVGRKYLDEEGDLFIVDSIGHDGYDYYLDVKYLKPVDAWCGLVRFYPRNIEEEGTTFTKVKTTQELSELAEVISVSTDPSEADVEPSSSLPDASTGTKNDSGKLRFDLLPADSIQEVVQVITYGETKYPSVEIEGKKVQNWKVLPDNENRLFAATMRHLWQHRSGELLDQETKLKHLAHAASSLMFLINIENEKLEGTN